MPPVGRRVFTLLLLVGAFLLAGPAGPASAHAYLAGSAPSDGAVVVAAPGELALHFSESVVLAATHIDVVDSDGHHYQPTNLRLLGGSDDTEDPTSVVAKLPQLPKNAYRVSWETLSSDDLHRTSGVVIFGIGTQVKAAPLAEPLPRAEEAGLRWIVFLGLSLTLGGLFAGRLLRRQDPESRSARRAEMLALTGATAAALVAIGLLVDQVASGGWPAGGLLGSTYGRHWIVREAGLLLLSVTTTLARVRASRMPERATPGRTLNVITAVGAAAACTGSALLGHSGAAHGFSPTRVAADAAHLAAAGLWAGAVVVFALLAAPVLRAGGRQASDLRGALRAFGLPAAACVGVMLVTGVFLASSVVGSVDAALLTFYGRTLLVKLGVAAIAAAFGLSHAIRLRRSRSGALPRRTLGLEAGAATLVLLLAGILTSAQPATEPQLVQRAASATVPVVDGQANDLQETLALRPNLPGRNVALVGIFDTRRPALAPVAQVRLSLVSPDGSAAAPVSAERLADGQWSAAFRLTTGGPIRVLVTVVRPGLPTAQRTYQWTVGSPQARAKPATVSRAPLSGVLRAVSAGLLAALLCAAAVILWLRRRSHPAPGPAPALEEGGEHEVQELVAADVGS
jgi:copper transport protein